MSRPTEVVENIVGNTDGDRSPMAISGPEVDDAWAVLRARYAENPERFRERWRMELAASKKKKP